MSPKPRTTTTLLLLLLLILGTTTRANREEALLWQANLNPRAAEAAVTPAPEAQTELPKGATCGPWTLAVSFPYSIPCPFSLGGVKSVPGFGTQPLPAGATCGPFTLPVALPFSLPCPYSIAALLSRTPATSTTTMTLVPDVPYTGAEDGASPRAVPARAVPTTVLSVRRWRLESWRGV